MSAQNTTLNQQGYDMLALLEAVDRFSAVGQPVSASVTRCQSWKDASRLCASDEWDRVLLKHRNELTLGLFRSGHG